MKPFVPRHETKSFKRLKLSETPVDWIHLTVWLDWLGRVSCFNWPVLLGSIESFIG